MQTFESFRKELLAYSFLCLTFRKVTKEIVLSLLYIYIYISSCPSLFFQLVFKFSVFLLFRVVFLTPYLFLIFHFTISRPKIYSIKDSILEINDLRNRYLRKLSSSWWWALTLIQHLDKHLWFLYPLIKKYWVEIESWSIALVKLLLEYYVWFQRPNDTGEKKKSQKWKLRLRQKCIVSENIFLISF